MRNTRVQPQVSKSKTSQESGWSAVYKKAVKLVEDRPNDHLVSILAELREIEIGRSDPGSFYRDKEVVRPLATKLMARAGQTANDGFLYPEVSVEGYSIAAVSKVRYLSKLMRPSTTAVVELGSGWSSNLFQLYLARGATRSRLTRYYGGEYTTAGIVCGKFLAQRDPLLKYTGFRFDYRTPNIQFLSKQRGHILVYTCHSVEQVEDINPYLFEQLLALPNPVTLVHFEPVGWQRSVEIMDRRKKGDTDYFNAIGDRVAQGDISSVTENAAWWSWRSKYNRNLISILDSLEQRGEIQPVRKVFDYQGSANVLNPVTLLHFDFVRKETS